LFFIFIFFQYQRRGAEKVIAFDILPKPHDAIKTSKVQVNSCYYYDILILIF